MALIPWNAAQTVNTTTISAQDFPTIAQLNDGSMVVTWTDRSSGNDDVKFQRFDALGNKLGVETLAHVASASDQSGTDITALSDGGFVISYVDSGFVFARIYSATGVAQGAGGSLLLSNPPLAGFDEFGPPKVQALAGGAFAIFYTTTKVFSPAI